METLQVSMPAQAESGKSDAMKDRLFFYVSQENLDAALSDVFVYVSWRWIMSWASIIPQHKQPLTSGGDLSLRYVILIS
jgi:hypothetical protein